MKTPLFALLALSLFAGIAQAAPVEALQAVLESKDLKTLTQKYGQDIQQIKETAVYRCPGCFRFEVVLGRGESAHAVSFGTRGEFRNGRLAYVAAASEEVVVASRPACIAMGRVGGEGEACAQHLTQSACESREHWEFCRWDAR